MARLFRTDGSTEEVTPMSGVAFTLPELYRLIGCQMIELVRLRSGNFLVLDEEGKLRRPMKPRNLNADLATLGVIRPDDFIVGDALVVTGAEIGEEEE